MNVNELMALLKTLPPEERQKPIMLEIEREIYLNLNSIKHDCGRFVILSCHHDPFEEALKKVLK